MSWRPFLYGSSEIPLFVDCSSCLAFSFSFVGSSGFQLGKGFMLRAPQWKYTLSKDISLPTNDTAGDSRRHYPARNAFQSIFSTWIL